MVSNTPGPTPLLGTNKLKKYKTLGDKSKSAAKATPATPGKVADQAVVMKSGRQAHSSCVRTITGIYVRDARKLIGAVNDGLPAETIPKLEKEYRVTRKEMAFALRIPTTTLNRRMAEGKLSTDESDRVVRYARLKDLATEMMQGNAEEAIAWLKTPAAILDDESPFEHATTEIGAREVEMLIGRIRHGVFS